MNRDKEILDRLSDNDLHVHVIDRDETYPFMYNPYNTHFIMQGEAIVCVGNLSIVESFALRQPKKKPQVNEA